MKTMQIPMNPMPDGTCRTIKSQYQQNSLANFLRRGGYGATGVIVIEEAEYVQEKYKADS